MNTINELMARYAAARLACYTRKLADERQAVIATQYAVEDMQADFRSRARRSEKEAIEVLAMDVEDLEAFAVKS